MANSALLLYSTNKLADHIYVKAIFSLSKTGKTFFSTNAISAAAFNEKKKIFMPKQEKLVGYVNCEVVLCTIKQLS